MSELGNCAMGGKRRVGVKNCDTYLDADGSAALSADMKMPTNSLISKQWRDLKAMA